MKRYSIFVRGFDCDQLETELCQVDDHPEAIARVLERKTTGTGREQVARYSSVRTVNNGENAS